MILDAGYWLHSLSSWRRWSLLPCRPWPTKQLGIDDDGFDPDAPGAVIVRQVDTSNSVIVRLNNNFRTAHFRIVIRGVDVVGVDDDFPGSIGLEGEWDDGIVGPCHDELLVKTG